MRRILIVDDQRDVRVMLRAGLQTLGRDISVVDVPSGEEALLVISGQPFDLLIIDVRLPGISGLELKQRAQVLNPKLKLVLITGLTDAAIRQQVIECGADAFFWKPVPMAEFLDTVDALLGRKSPVEAGPPQGSLSVDPAPDPLQQFLLNSGAQSALIFDDQENVLSRAGELPLIDERALLAVLKRTAQAGAGAKDPLGGVYLTQIHYFHTPGCDLFLSPLEPGRFFLVTTRGERPALPVGEMIQTIQGVLPHWNLAAPKPAARKPEEPPSLSVPSAGERETPLSRPVGERGVVPRSLGNPGIEGIGGGAAQQDHLRAEDIFARPGDPPAVVDESLPSLEELFGEAAARTLDQDAGAFWDALVEENGEAPVRPDAISYDEAQELGLAPEEK